MWLPGSWALLFSFALLVPLSVASSQMLSHASHIPSSSSVGYSSVPAVRQERVCPVVLARPVARPNRRPPRRISATSLGKTSAFEPRVVGGLNADLQTQSFLVALSDSTDHFKCSGSLLSARWVLTAAHCGVQRGWRLRAGTPSATTGPWIPILRVLVHELYVEDSDMDQPGDIALVQLAASAPSTARFVVINDNAMHPLSGSFARAAGYGKTRLGGQEIMDPLPNQVDGPVNSPVKCNAIYKGFLNVSERYFVCVGYGRDGCRADSCHGDSGGPLIQFDGRGRAVQIGIVSFGLECGAEGIPSVYVRVSPFVEWMREQQATFERAGTVTSVFAEGSEEAKSDDAEFTVLQLTQNQTEVDVNSSDVRIPRATFIALCVIAGIALVALIFLSLIFVSERGCLSFPRRHADARVDASANRTRGALLSAPTVPDDGQLNNVQLAISLLQAIADRTPQQGADFNAFDTSGSCRRVEKEAQPCKNPQIESCCDRCAS